MGVGEDVFQRLVGFEVAARDVGAEGVLVMDEEPGRARHWRGNLRCPGNAGSEVMRRACRSGLRTGLNEAMASRPVIKLRFRYN